MIIDIYLPCFILDYAGTKAYARMVISIKLIVITRHLLYYVIFFVEILDFETIGTQLINKARTN